MPNNLKAKLIFLLFSIIAVLIFMLTFLITVALSVILLPVGLILLPRMVKSTFQKQRKVDIIEVTDYKQIADRSK
jgi:Flp pilus assembly protein TadB